MFELHPQLAKDCLIVGEGPLSRVLLMNDSRYPWVILVPRRGDIREIHHLSEADLGILMGEIAKISQLIGDREEIHKVNVGALGNIVPQLHIHIVGRTKSDDAWPGPVWGVGKAQPYTPEGAGVLCKYLEAGLSGS